MVKPFYKLKEQCLMFHGSETNGSTREFIFSSADFQLVTVWVETSLVKELDYSLGLVSSCTNKKRPGVFVCKKIQIFDLIMKY